jgi:hypothetical protein
MQIFKVTDSEGKIVFYDLTNFMLMLNKQFDLMKFEVHDE